MVRGWLQYRMIRRSCLVISAVMGNGDRAMIVARPASRGAIELVHAMWRMAEFFERTARAHPAMIAKAEARRLFHDAPGVTSRFAEFLFGKVMYFSKLVDPSAQKGAPSAEAGEEEAAKVAPAGEKRTPGGLILP